MRTSKERQSAIESEGAVMKRCRHWDPCNAPDCPLDPSYGERGPVQEGEEVCHAGKSTHLRIVAEARAAGVPTVLALPYGGLTRREHGGELRSRRMKAEFAALPEHIKERKRAEAKQRLSRARKMLPAGG